MLGMVRKILYCLIILLLVLLQACDSYGLRDKLENPGEGGGGGNGGGLTSCGGVCRIFVSQTTVQGNFGGPTQADAICMNDANRPPGNRLWKAMVVGLTRKACGTANCSNGDSEHVDWVMRPATQYVRADGVTVIGVTHPSAGIWIFNLANSISGASAQPWTGLATDWTLQSSAVCHDSSPFTPWVRNQSSQAGTIGDAVTVSNTAITANSSRPCDNYHPFFCVEQ